jgi:hypothetical protein
MTCSLFFIGASVYAQTNNNKKNKPVLKSPLKDFEPLKVIIDVKIIE